MKLKPRKRLYDISLLFVLLLLSGCSASRFVPDGSYMLKSVKIESDDAAVDASQLTPYIRQRANSKWFSTFKIPLGVYSMSGRDTTRWNNRLLQGMGEAPVIYDAVQTEQSSQAMKQALDNMGYMDSHVTYEKRIRRKRLRLTYKVHPGDPYIIRHVHYDIQDDSIAKLLDMERLGNRGLRTGGRFTVDRLDTERKRITNQLLAQGYYRFHKDFIRYDADTASGDNGVDVTLHLMKYKANSDAAATLHPRYMIDSVRFHASEGTSRLPLRKRVLEYNTLIDPGEYFNYNALQSTYNSFSRLQAIRYTNIEFTPACDTLNLNCDITLTPQKPNSISFQPEGTNTSGDLGAAASLTYLNRNVFRGSEQFSITLRGAFEAITGLEGYQDHDYQEYGAEAKLMFPRFLAPFLSRSFRRKVKATTELSLSYNTQNRPEFHRQVLSAVWRYRWSEPRHNMAYRFDLLDLDYVRMPWISAKFKHDYLDSVSNRNAILRYNYEDLFIAKTGFGITYNTGNDVVRSNIETAGNLLHFVSHATGAEKHEHGQYKYFNIAYAQYAKFDLDYTHMVQFDVHNSLALHAALGIAYPYGNSKVLPFEKRYFSGGANSVRGWGVRELGPGAYKGTDAGINFINQTGDMKLTLNAEYRTLLFWKLNGALFVDAGNIWTLRDYAEQPGGQFKFGEFYKQIAVAYGVGFRLNFDYFVLRVDMGMKAINPAYDNAREHYAICHPDVSRDFAFHFAVGLPF
jgi:outer membrane protein assembly factor BamA